MTYQTIFCKIKQNEVVIKSLRKWHRLISAVVAIPFAITLITGIFLITRSHFNFLQPKHSEAIQIDQSKVSSIQDLTQAFHLYYQGREETQSIASIIYSPKNGQFSVRTNEDREIRFNAQSLEVIAEGPKRTTLLIKLHEGLWFSSYVRDFIFLPSSIGLFFLLISGIILFFKHYHYLFLRGSK